MKRIISLIGIFCLMIPSVASAAMIDFLTKDLLEDNVQFFSDVSSDHHNYVSVSWMADAGPIEGYSDGTFKPDNTVNRAELMKMVVLMNEESVDDSYGNCFSDVTDEWFAKYVCYGLEKGWIEGYPDNTFKPGRSVNRVEAIKIGLNAMIPRNEWPDATAAEMSLEMPVDLDADAWYYRFVRFAIAKELVDGWHVVSNNDGSLNFYPDGGMTRKEVAEMLFRVMLYGMERQNYAYKMATAICFYADNSEIMTESELNDGMVDIFEEDGYTEEEMDEFAVVFEEDNIVQALITELVTEECGSGSIDVSNI